MELHFIEIPKLKKVDDSEEISDMLEAWITFIQSPTSKVINKLERSSQEIKQAKEELLRLSGDDKERERYEKRKESILEKVSLIETAEQKGIEKGKKEGLKEGAKKEKFEIAKKLLDILDDETISIKIGLPLEEIKELRNKAN